MTRQEIEELIYGRPEQQRRFTQDFPILPDVWIAFAENPNRRIELLLTPYSPTTAAVLSRALRDRSEQEQEALERYRAIHSPDDRKLPRRPRVLFNESVVFANFTFEELIRVAMPLTDWWKDNMAVLTTDRWDKKDIDVFIRLIQERQGAESLPGGDPRLLRKLITIVGTIECDRYQQRYSTSDDIEKKVNQPQMDAFTELLNGLTNPQEHRGLLYSISLNRLATTSIWRSRMAVKADAAARVFDVDTSGIRWAVLDVGIDAKHKAFARRERGKSGNADNIVKETQTKTGGGNLPAVWSAPMTSCGSKTSSTQTPPLWLRDRTQKHWRRQSWRV
ncbi:MAG TPA: hypothetical protein VII23_00040 [Terriglobales bacterium]